MPCSKVIILWVRASLKEFLFLFYKPYILKLFYYYFLVPQGRFFQVRVIDFFQIFFRFYFSISSDCDFLNPMWDFFKINSKNNSDENSEKINRGDPYLKKNLPWGTKGIFLKKIFFLEKSGLAILTSAQCQ